MRSILDDECGVDRPVPYGFVATNEDSADKRSASEQLVDHLVLMTGVFTFYGTFGLLATTGWLLYKGFYIEVSPGIALYTAIAVTLAVAIAGGVFWYLRDVKLFAMTAVAQIIVASIIATTTVFVTSESSKWIAVTGSLVAVADGFKALMEIRSKKLMAKQ